MAEWFCRSLAARRLWGRRSCSRTTTVKFLLFRPHLFSVSPSNNSPFFITSESYLCCEYRRRALSMITRSASLRAQSSESAGLPTFLNREGGATDDFKRVMRRCQHPHFPVIADALHLAMAATPTRPPARTSLAICNAKSNHSCRTASSTREQARQGWFRKDNIVPNCAQMAKLVRAGGLVGVGSHGEMQGIGYHWEMWMLASAA